MKKYSKNIWSFGNLRNALFISQFLIVPCKYIYGQTPSPFLKLLLWILTAVLLFPSHLLFPFFFSPPESWRHRGRYQELLQRRRTRLLQISSTRYIAVKLFFFVVVVSSYRGQGYFKVSARKTKTGSSCWEAWDIEDKIIITIWRSSSANQFWFE